MNIPNYNPVTQKIVDELQQICGKANVVFDNEKTLQKYSRDQIAEQRYAHMPEVVVKPGTAAEIAGIMKLANREIIPVTPRAAGSGLSGGAVPVFGGILLSIERMNRIIEIDDQNLMAVVEPGVVTNKLDQALQEYSLFFAGYPMSDEFCFIGGNVAENAGGGRAVKYGVTGRYIHGLEVVTPEGEIIRLGGTISGEHGIGHKRRDYMELVMEPAQLDVMRRIKAALDPNHILNPGKIFSM